MDIEQKINAPHATFGKLEGIYLKVVETPALKQFFKEHPEERLRIYFTMRSDILTAMLNGFKNARDFVDGEFVEGEFKPTHTVSGKSTHWANALLNTGRKTTEK